MECRSAKRRKFSKKTTPLELAERYCNDFEDPPGFDVRPVDTCIGDGVFTTRSFESGDFLLVYRGDLIKSHKYARQLEDEYEQKGEGSFMFYFKNKGRSYCIDATNDIFHQGRMINDAEKGDPKQNCVIKVVMVDEKPHLCIFASRDIITGEELRYDYGIPTLPWRKKIKTKLQEPTRREENGSCSDMVSSLSTSGDKEQTNRIEVGNEPEQDVSSIGHTATQSEEIQTEPMCKDNQMPGTSSNTSENIARIEVGNKPEQDVSSIGHTATQSEEIQTEPMCKENQMPGTSSNTSENIAQTDTRYFAQPLSSPLSLPSEGADSYIDPSYSPTKDSTSSDDSEIIPNIAKFAKPSPRKSERVRDESPYLKKLISENEGIGNSGGVSSSDISVQRTNNNETRRYDKRYFCLYCKNPVTKLSKHLIAKHAEEDDIVKYMSEENKSSKTLLIEKMRHIGNHIHNTNVIETGKGELAVVYRPRDNQNIKVEDYGPCPHCYGYFPKNDLWRHNKHCKFSPNFPGRRNLVASSQMMLSSVKNDRSNTLSKIMSALKADQISRIAKSDPTILAYGERLSTKQGHDEEQFNHIRQKMREIARLLKKMRETSGHSSYTFDEFVYPENFKFIVKCCKEVAGFDSSTNTYATPSLALKLGGSVQKCLKLLISKALQTSNKELQDRAEALSKLFDYNWTEEVSSNALRTLNEGKRNARKGILPLANDVKLLSEYLRNEAATVSKRLQNEEYSENARKDWVHLSEISLAQTILFNRRRAGEVSKMTTEDFKKRALTNEENELDGGLSNFEKKLCKSFYRTEIVAKRGRTAPVLFPTKLKDTLELLLRKRTLISNPENKFLFPTQTTRSHIRGTDVMRMFASQCGAEQPERLRSTKLRKHIATMTQLFNLNENELDILANFLGHDIRVHREFYRLPEETIQVAKVSKLLLLMESGKITNPSMTSLDSIDIEEEQDTEYGDADEEEEENSDTSDDSNVESEVAAAQKSIVSSEDSSKSTRKRYWSMEERDAVKRHLEKDILMGRIPGKSAIENCLKIEHVLCGRSWRNIKDYCRNTIQTRKRKGEL